MNELDPTTIALYIRLGIFGIFLILGLVLLLRRLRLTKPDKPENQQEVNALEPGFSFDKRILASLTVLESDDPSMINTVISVSKYPFTLGRNPNNDFSFPNDLAVSNFHARLIKSENKILLTEMVVDAKGLEKRPKYGTFINDTLLRTTTIQLRDKDIIRLGARLRLQFERVDTTGLPDTIDEKTEPNRQL
ncbi:MAG: FHA domain-containing protein [Chloroflexota bacterium]